MRKTAACFSVGILVLALMAAYFWSELDGPQDPRGNAPAGTNSPSVSEDASADSDAGLPQSGRADMDRPLLQLAAPRPAHPLLEKADDAVLTEPGDAIRSTAEPELREMIRAVIGSGLDEGTLADLKIDYPQNESVFPPRIVAPTFLWHEPIEGADTWLIDVGFSDDSARIYVLSPGLPPPAGQIDPECIAENNEIYKPTPYQASARSWTPGGDLWAAIRQRSAGLTTEVTVLGFSSSGPPRAVSRGRITITTSNDVVGAPIFFRDVPLAPSKTQEGVIKPLGEDAVGLIAWRLRDISSAGSRLLLTGVLTCTNCHSFSADGRTLGMDLDGPQGDKGAYVIAPVTKKMVIEGKNVISWNSFKDKPEGHKTIGFLSQVSPDGQYVVTTLNEALYVSNFLDYKFLQVFYPTRGILGYYSRTTGEIKALPGADDPKYVHCDAVWSPEGDYLVFARAEAKDPYPEGRALASRPNDPAETRIQYDLYRIAFNDGQGGKPERIAGASVNGMSNTFPKVSPDGNWIVFVKCRNGQLMRPDSELWIVPAGGGTARLMRCNTSRMNSWHSFSPNSRWLVFSSKANTPYTQMFLTHIDSNGNDSPAILIPNSTAANRAVNIPEFINISYDELQSISAPTLEYLKHGMRGVELARKGMLDEALAEFEMAIRAQPDYLEGHVNAAVILIEKGMLDEARARLTNVLRLDPKRWDAHGNFGMILARQGKVNEALVHLSEALKLNPAYVEAHSNLGTVLSQKGMLEVATAHFHAAVKFAPNDPRNRLDLGNVLLERGMREEAIEQFRKCLELAPRFVDAHLLWGDALAAQGDFEAALAQYQKATSIAPDYPRAINDLAWLLAVCPHNDVRNGARALQLVEPACTASGYRDPILLTTLAAAHAEVGDFSQAVAIAAKALRQTNPQDQALTQRIRQNLQGYRQGKPCRRWQ